VHAYGSKHFSHRLFSAHVLISCAYSAYGSYRLREFDCCANLNTSIIPCMHGWGIQFKTGEYFNINFKLIVIFSWVSYVSLAQQIRSKMKYNTDTSKCHPRCWDLHSVKTCEKLSFEPYLRLNFLHRGKRRQTTNCLMCMPTAANIFRTDYFPLNHVLIYCAFANNGSYRLRKGSNDNLFVYLLCAMANSIIGLKHWRWAKES
jgi:hypothetical protein